MDIGIIKGSTAEAFLSGRESGEMHVCSIQRLSCHKLDLRIYLHTKKMMCSQLIESFSADPCDLLADRLLPIHGCVKAMHSAAIFIIAFTKKLGTSFTDPLNRNS